jgi:hypothetical protein
MATLGIFAYIDPMSGVFLLQILAAAVIGGLAFFRQAIWGMSRAVSRLGASRDELRSSANSPGKGDLP